MKERDRDMRIVQSILDAIESGKFPILARYETEFRDIQRRLSTGESTGNLWEFLAADLHVAEQGMQVAVERGLAFVRKEVATYAEIKTKRPLTDEEKRYGKQVLLPLLDGLERLIGRRRGKQRESGPGEA